MQPCMRGGGVKVEVAFFHVLPVVPLGIGQAKSPFLQDGIPAVPQRQAKTKPLRLVANTAQAIFIPTIDAGARLIMIEVSPGIAVRAIVFPNGSPGALGEVRPPQTPVLDTMLLLAVGVDFAVFWGVLSFLLSFIPNIAIQTAFLREAGALSKGANLLVQ